MRKRFDSAVQFNNTNSTQTQNAHSSLMAIKSEEEGKARILFVIIILFFICNTLR